MQLRVPYNRSPLRSNGGKSLAFEVTGENILRDVKEIIVLRVK
jgi:hypothetical protein